MVILALDTSSAVGSAAIARDGALVIERAGDATRTHGQRLPRELMAVLDDARLSLRDVDHFAVVTGPGSFTGLRVGIATIQGLALAQRKLVVPVSSFEALAFVAGAPAPTSNLQPPTSSLQPPASSLQPPAAIAPWIDAHRGEVFATLYAADARTPLVTATSLAPEATLDAWAAALDAAGRVLFTGDGALKYADVIRARLGARAVVPTETPLLAGAVARIASANPDRAVRPHAVVPLYVRRSDAELARDRRQAQP